MAGDLKFKIESTAPESMSNTRIKVIGVGGAGGNAVDYMITSGLQNVEFITANTDAQALNHTKAETKLALGQSGRGAGSRPDQGCDAAMQAADKIEEALKDADMVYISAGMGGGTGTGAAPVIAQIAREKGILTVAVVTKPFNFEGEIRMRVAEEGIECLAREVDALVVILNSKLEEELSDQDVSLEECFEEADKVLYNACSGIVQIIHNVGRINTDFEDVRSVMAEQGRAIIGVAEAEGEDRAVRALTEALSCPLLEDCNFRTVKNMLINVASVHKGLKQSEQRKMDQLIKDKLGDCQPFIKFGISTDDTLGDKLRVTIIGTGLDADQKPHKPIDTTSGNAAPVASSSMGGMSSSFNPEYSQARGTGPMPSEDYRPPRSSNGYRAAMGHNSSFAPMNAPMNAPMGSAPVTPSMQAQMPPQMQPQMQPLNPQMQPPMQAPMQPQLNPQMQPQMQPQLQPEPAAAPLRRPTVVSTKPKDRWNRGGENAQIPAVLRQESEK